MAANMQKSVPTEEGKLIIYDNFLSEFLKAVRCTGLVGEDQNALVVYLCAISRLMPRPLSVFVKGSSGSGKNHLVKSVLTFIPESEIREITTSSSASWSYQGDDLRNKLVYLQEENSASGNVHPTRLLISEGKLIRQVTIRQNGGWVSQRQVTQGPVACLSTTTKNEMEVDDESRHISIWIDESQQQTKQIIHSMIHGQKKLEPKLIAAWQNIHSDFKERAQIPVRVPSWMEVVAEWTDVKTLRARRYFQSFLDACAVVAMLRSFRHAAPVDNRQESSIRFSDYAITTLIFNDAFSKSLYHLESDSLGTRKKVADLVERLKRPIDADDLAKHHSLSAHQAYENLRKAASDGIIIRANSSEKANRKFYVPAPQIQFLPNPEKIFSKIMKRKKRISFLHPVSGKSVFYES